MEYYCKLVTDNPKNPSAWISLARAFSTGLKYGNEGVSLTKYQDMLNGCLAISNMFAETNEASAIIASDVTRSGHSCTVKLSDLKPPFRVTVTLLSKAQEIERSDKALRASLAKYPKDPELLYNQFFLKLRKFGVQDQEKTLEEFKSIWDNGGDKIIPELLLGTMAAWSTDSAFRKECKRKLEAILRKEPKNMFALQYMRVNVKNKIW